MKTIFAKKNLFLRVAVGFVLGVILGFAAPKFSIATKVVGDLYLNLIKKARYADIGAHTSAQCQDALSRAYKRRARQIPCSSSTKSTR